MPLNSKYNQNQIVSKQLVGILQGTDDL